VSPESAHTATHRTLRSLPAHFKLARLNTQGEYEYVVLISRVTENNAVNFKVFGCELPEGSEQSKHVAASFFSTRNIPTVAQAVTIYSPHPVLLSRLWATIQQARIELPEDGVLKR
jgi:hypothetical protein